MSVNSVTQRPTNPALTSQSEGTNSPAPLLRNSSEQEIPFVQGQSNPDGGLSTADSGDIPEPDPNGDPMARAQWVQQEIESIEQELAANEQAQEDNEREREDIEDLLANRDDLEFLAENSEGAEADEARALLDRLNEMESQQSSLEDAYRNLQRQHEDLQTGVYEDLQDELDELSDYLPGADLDGDGRANEADPDIDGDGLTQEAEVANGTDIYAVDTDGDGITDYGEIWLRENNMTYGWMDPTNADADHNGEIDGLQLPASVARDRNGNSILTSNRNNPAGGTPTTPPPGTTSQDPLQWAPASLDAQRVSTTDGSRTVGGTGDVVVNLNGEDVSFSEDDGDLLVTTDEGTIRIENYQERRVFFEGTAGNLSTETFDFNNLTPRDTDSDGYANVGVHFASTIHTTDVESHYDPFNGSMPINEGDSTDAETVYETAGASGEFTVPSEINGREVKAVIVTLDGDDVIVTLKAAPEGETLKTFRLRNGRDRIQNFPNPSIEFKLADNDQYFYSAESRCKVTGGTGKDYITIKGGAAYGGEGSDILRAIDEDARLDGGLGDDFLEGGSGVDHLIGGEGEGMDFGYSGDSVGDTIDLGDGADTLIVEHTNPTDSYTIRGGGGTDMGNYTGAGMTGVEVDQLNDLDGLISHVRGMITGADGTPAATGSRLDELNKALADLEMAQSMGASTVADAAVMLLSRKESDRYTEYGGAHEEGVDIPTVPIGDRGLGPDPEDDPTDAEDAS